MKKICAVILTLALLAGFGAYAAYADEEYRRDGDFWMYDAPKTEEILNWGAGYESTTWEIPYLNTTPILDGAIQEDEYHPFENFEDYLTLMASVGTDAHGTTYEEFDTFRINAEFFGGTGGFVKPYWGWDGTYLYMAFEVQNLNGFYCNPTTPLYLFTQNCLQIGIGDEAITGNMYTELGFGVNSESGQLITHTWLGDYRTGENDYGGHYDGDTGVVTYECRISLADTVGIYNAPDDPVSAGDIVKFAWLLSVNGEGNRLENGQIVTGEEWQVGFCHGIGGPYSYKASEFFAVATLGAPITEIETETEPTTDPETQPTTDTTIDADTAPATEPVIAPVTEPMTVPVTEPVTVPVTEPESGIESDSETASATDSASDAVTDESETIPTTVADTDKETSAHTDTSTTAPDQDGCSSVILVASLPLTAVLLSGVFALLHKKED